MGSKKDKLNIDQELKQIVNEFGPMIVNLAHRFVGNNDDAHDIAQEVFVKAWNNFSSFEGSSSLKTWLYRIGVNESLNFLRKKKMSSFIESLESGLSFSHYKSETSEDQFIKKEEKNLVRKAIKSLPKNQRIALTLKSLKNLSYEEIAKVMSISKSSVESLLFRAKKNLKKKLSKYYFSNY